MKEKYKQKLIKNFCIIAHIDHGKSTLSDRLIEKTNSIPLRDMKPQILDSMELEQEKGITIKLNCAQMEYKGIQLNLIDTPGHADFSYEVSRSLSACEGAILLVDATKGVQAQTLSNYFLAQKANLKIIICINKIDNSAADIDRINEEIEKKLGQDPSKALHISAKTGVGIEKLLDAIITEIPSAPTEIKKPLKALVFDSYYDSFKGAIMFLRVFEGFIRKKDKILFMKKNKTSEVFDLGIKTPYMKSADCLYAGEVGWINANIKNLSEIKVGDTITWSENMCSEAFPGYEEVLPTVYSSFFPIVAEKQNLFKSAIEKLSLSDGSLVFQYESSASLGFGCRCGFLGLLHLEIVKERLFREYKIEVIVTNPSVRYKVNLTDKSSIYLTSPSNLPEITKIESIEEPYVLVSVNIPTEYIGQVTEFLVKCRSIYIDLIYLNNEQCILKYEIPLSEVIQDFYDVFKSITHGYGFIDYKFSDYRVNKLVKVDILINGVITNVLSFICEKTQAYRKGKDLVEKLKLHIPQHLFEVSIQAAINNKIIASEKIKALRKNVTAKCYGGDVSRKKKLWEKQKAGKKKMKQIGKVLLPADIFEKVLKN